MGRRVPAKVRLRFDPATDRMRTGKQFRDGLSGVAGVLDTLWVASDETLSVERLDRVRGREPTFAAHATFAIEKFLRLPDGMREEADVEDLDISGGYLWMVGSHAAEREMPGDGASPRKIARTLAKVARQGNRCLLARIPIVQAGKRWTLARRTGHGAHKRRAARIEGNAKGNALTRALGRDEHFRYTLAPPGKENGFDIEGLAVVGERVLLGLRGPVFNQWAAIIEIQPCSARNHPELLRLARFGSGRKLYRKHFLKLDGLGIRALCRHGPDLLVLAGPVAAVHGPVRLYRWVGGARTDVERRMRPADLHPVMDLPTGQGSDYPEGIVVVPATDGRDRLLVVYERASRKRFHGAHDVDADLFVIPR